MATRRNFFKYLGLAGSVAGGGIVAAAAVIPDPDKCKAVNEIETNRSHGCLALQQGYGEKKDNEALRIDNNGPMHIGIAAPKTPLKVTNVSMTPGPDGEMYLNINGKWRRIVTE